MNLLVMSRPIPALEKALGGAVRLDIEASTTDIENYLRQRLEATNGMQKHFTDEPSLRDSIVLRIIQR